MPKRGPQVGVAIGCCDFGPDFALTPTMTFLTRNISNRPYQRTLGLGLGLFIAVSLGASGRVVAEPISSPVQNEALFKLAKQWVAEHEGLRADDVQFLPTDARLDLQHCSANNLEIDSPFGSNRTLRLRCGEGNQQVFLHRKDSAHGSKEEKVGVQYGNATARSESLSEISPIATVGSGASSGKTPAVRAGVSEQVVLVAASPLLANQPLSPSLFRLEKREIFGNPRQFVQSPSELPFLELLKPLKPGELLKQRDTRKARLVRKGTPVQFQFVSNPSVRLQVELQAMEDGFFGDKIRLKNPESGRIIMGLVTNRGEARSF